MSNENDQQTAKKPSKLERERAIYAKMGKKHPKDAALDFALRYFKGMAAKRGSTSHGTGVQH
jgi:hypothetical protein